MTFRSRLSSLAICVLAVATVLAAQQTKVLAPHKPIPPRAEKQIKWLTPATQRSMVGGLWMTDADFKSSIYLKNGVETDPVTVTPILHLSNGAKYTLPDVVVKPAGLAIISINDELQKKGISSWATLSGYVELLYTWPWNPFCATVRNVDVAHSLIFTYPLRPTAPPPLNLMKPIFAPPTHTVEGMWWKHEKNVTGFIAIANLTAQPADATVQITDDRAQPISQHRVSVSPHGMKLIKLPELQTTELAHGGVRITSSETSDNLVINGGLEDQTIGYSAGMPFAFELLMQAEPEDVTVAELGLMVGAADPMMLFPAGTTFTPYSILRNVSDGPLSITPTLWWMEGGKPRSALLPQIVLPPLHTQNLDVASLLALFGPKNFNGSFNIAFETVARRGSLVMASGSVDQTGTYVFEVGPRGVGESASKSLQQWSTGNGDDTMVTVWNPADEVQEFAFTLFFEGGHYSLPLHMQPRETRTFNASEVIQNQVPDAEGNLIPSAVHQGTAKIAGSQAENQHILVALDAGIYNVRKATCSQSCQECDGYNNFYVIDAPFSVALNGTHQESSIAQYHSGSTYGLSSNWSSNKTTVATVSGGLVTGKAVGSVTVTATTTTSEPVDAGYICTGGNPCPTSYFANSGGGTVPPTIQISPSTGQQGATVPVTISASNGGLGSTPGTITTTAGSQISVAKGTWSDSTINATFTINSSAAAQSYTVVVTTASNDTTCPSCQPTTSFYVTAQCNPTVVATAQTISCDGKTVHEGKLTISGANEANVTDTIVSAQSSSVLNLDLQGSAYRDSTFCSSGQICYGQNYIGYLKPGANINWNVQIFCSNSPFPSKTATPSETITCQ